MSVKILYLITGQTIPPQVIGAVFSTLLFLFACLLFTRELSRSAPTLTPLSRMGWLFFLFSPASWIFHSHHTESLFFVLLVLAFFKCAKGSWKTAAFFAGLTALTRNHGVLVAIVIGLWNASNTANLSDASKRFVVSGLISGSLYLLFPIYQAWLFGNPFAFMNAHDSYWAVASNLQEYFGTYFFANEIQNTNLGSILRLFFVLVLWITAFRLFKLNRFSAILVAFYLVLMPLQKEFVDAFRFGAVLFPALFYLGDQSRRLPLGLQWIVILCILALNHDITIRAAIGRWAY